MYDPARDGPHVSIPTPRAYSWGPEYDATISGWRLSLIYNDRAAIEKAMTALRAAMAATERDPPNVELHNYVDEIERASKEFDGSTAVGKTQPTVTAEDVAELADIVANIADRMMPGQVALKWKAETLANRLRGGGDV
jgi:hypothetical protein